MEYILILFLATSSSSQAGAAAVSQGFSSNSACLAAGNSLVKAAEKRGNYVIAWGCYQK